MRDKIFMMMVATALLCVCDGCTDLLPAAEEPLTLAEQVTNWTDSVALYREQARQGDAEAYLKLACCYHEGKGVEHDLPMMLQMMRMALQYDCTLDTIKLINSLTPGSADRLVMEAIIAIDQDQYDTAYAKASQLASLGDSNTEFVRGLIALGTDYVEEALSLLHIAASQGSMLAQLFVAFREDDQQTCLLLAPHFPYVYCSLARINYPIHWDPREDDQAAMYYRRADSLLCLDPIGINWMLDYDEHMAEIRSPVLDSLERARLQKLADIIGPLPHY